MTRTWPLVLLLALTPLAATPAPAAHAGGLVKPSAKAALKERRVKVKRDARNNARKVHGRWNSLARAAATLSDFGPQEIRLAEHDVTGASATGLVASQGYRLVETLVLQRSQAPQEYHRNGTAKPAREVYTPMVDVLQVDAQGNRYSSGRYTIGPEEARASGQVQYSYKQFGGLFGSMSSKAVPTARARSAQAKRNWGMVRQLARELRRELRAEEEVFLGEAAISRLPNQEPTDGHRYTARLFLVRRVTPQQQRYNQKTGSYEYFSINTVQPVVVIRQTDGSGNLIQELRQTVGGTTNGMSDVAPTEMTELLGSLDSAKLLHNANESLGELVRESR